jgi:hypothetical protein
VSPPDSTAPRPGDTGGDEPADQDRLVAVAQTRLRIIAAVLAFEAVAIVGVAVYLVVNLIAGTERGTETENTVIEIVAFTVIGGLLLLLARGCLRARAWARAPVVLAQLIAFFGVGVNILQGDLWYRWVLGLPLTLGALAAAVLILTPAVTALLHESSD